MLQDKIFNVSTSMSPYILREGFEEEEEVPFEGDVEDLGMEDLGPEEEDMEDVENEKSTS